MHSGPELFYGEIKIWNITQLKLQLIGVTAPQVAIAFRASVSFLALWSMYVHRRLAR
jgi:hypothetical protein